MSCYRPGCQPVLGVGASPGKPCSSRSGPREPSEACGHAAGHGVNPTTAVVVISARAMTRPRPIVLSATAARAVCSPWSLCRRQCRPRRCHFRATGQGVDPFGPGHGLVLVRSATATQVICDPWLCSRPRSHSPPAGRSSGASPATASCLSVWPRPRELSVARGYAAGHGVDLATAFARA